MLPAKSGSRSDLEKTRIFVIAPKKKRNLEKPDAEHPPSHDADFGQGG